MTEFQAGTRVRYINTGPAYALRGELGTVTNPHGRNGWIIVDFDNGYLETKCAETSLILAGDANLQLLPTQTSYMVEIPTADMLALLKAEDATDFEALFTKLHSLEGVNDATYDGHFGANIFLSIEHEEDTPDRHQEVIKVIRDHLEKCRQGAAHVPVAKAPVTQAEAAIACADFGHQGNPCAACGHADEASGA
jgi:hypothetical protein